LAAHAVEPDSNSWPILDREDETAISRHPLDFLEAASFEFPAAREGG
jgi:hypothetical protein